MGGQNINQLISDFLLNETFSVKTVNHKKDRIIYIMDTQPKEVQIIQKNYNYGK